MQQRNSKPAANHRGVVFIWSCCTSFFTAKGNQVTPFAASCL
jgi:hypothetical protein